MTSTKWIAVMAFVALLGGCVCTTPGSCPDIIVALDFNTLSVECPTGGGSCVSTIDVTVTNDGAAAAGGFDIRVRFDSGTVIQHVDGLAAGQSATFTVATVPGANCFDPDCTVCATADVNDDVNETNENNNLDCGTNIG